MNASRRLIPLSALVAFLVLTAALLVTPALASVDLVSPAQGAYTNAANLTFNYYPSLPGVQQCTLSVDSQIFPDTTITDNAFNSFTVVNIGDGSHTWRIACQAGNTTDLSVVRSLTIDRTPPAVTILSPAENATAQNATMLFTATDSISGQLNCTANANATIAGAATVQNATPTALNLSLPASGSYVAMLTCLDAAGNAGSVTRTFTYSPPPPTLFLNLSTDRQSYGLGDAVALTIDSLPGANVSVDVCPDTQGFVQCYTPLIQDVFPETVIMPFTNRTGGYIVEGVALYGNQSASVTANYTVRNTMAVAITADDVPEVGKEFHLTASTTGATGAVNYTWNLSDGSTVTGQSIPITYDAIGDFTERVTATDVNGNNATATYSTSLLPEYKVTVHVTDAQTGSALPNATVQLHLADGGSADQQTLQTDDAGDALFVRTPDIYQLFISLDGYSYYLNQTNVSADVTIPIALAPFDNVKPVVTILSPEDGATVNVPTTVAYQVKDSSAAKCTLSYAKAGEQWLQQGGTQDVTDTAQHAFTLDSLEETAYTAVVDCVDASGNDGQSGPVNFTVSQSAPTATATDLTGNGTFPDDPLSVIDRAYGAYDSFSPDQRTLADLLGWQDTIKQAQLTIERSQRDLQALDFQPNLNASAKQEKQQALQDAIAKAQASVPTDIAVLEKRTSVDYLNDSDLAALAGAIASQKGYAFTGKALVGYLQQVQQAFTQERTLIRAKMVMADGTEQPISVVISSFTYEPRILDAGGSAPGNDSFSNATVNFTAGGLSGSYTLYEAIPETVAAKANEVISMDEDKVLSPQPVALEFAPTQQVVYYVKKDVPLDQLAGVKTVLLKKPTLDEVNALTGNASLLSFGGIVLDWKLSLLLTALLAVLILVVRRMDLLRHVRYLFYAESRKGPLHAVRTLVNDGLEQLEGGSLEQAMMRYKEAKLSYERLGSYAQNEAFADMERLRAALDGAYFNALVNRIRDALDENRLADAIDDYERLEGTFGLLGAEEQAGLMAIVLELGRRLGLGEGETRGETHDAQGNAASGTTTGGGAQ